MEINNRIFLPDLSTKDGAIKLDKSLVTPIIIVAKSGRIDEPAVSKMVVAKNNTTATPLVCWKAPSVKVRKRDILLDLTVNISVQSRILLVVSPFFLLNVSRTLSTSADLPSRSRVFVTLTGLSEKYLMFNILHSKNIIPVENHFCKQL